MQSEMLRGNIVGSACFLSEWQGFAGTRARIWEKSLKQARTDAQSLIVIDIVRVARIDETDLSMFTNISSISACP